MITAYRWVADKTYSTFLERGKFVWNQFLNNDPKCPSCGDVPEPWVRSIVLSKTCNNVLLNDTVSNKMTVSRCGRTAAPRIYTASVTPVGHCTHAQ